MILINLLPHREAARKRRRAAFFASLGVAAVAGVLIAGAVYLWYMAQISSQQDRNAFLQQEIAVLESQIKDVKALQQEIAALRARQQAVEDLQLDRNMPVHLLNELVKQVPDGIFVTSLKQANDVVEIAGVAQSQERVSELLRNLSSNSPWLTQPELVEIVAATAKLGPKDDRRVSNFSIKTRLVRASDMKKAATAGGAASGAKSANASAAPVSTNN